MVTAADEANWRICTVLNVTCLYQLLTCQFCCTLLTQSLPSS